MSRGEIEIFRTGSGTEILVSLDNDTDWLGVHLLAKLFDVKRPAVVKHVNNIYKSRELFKKTTRSILEQVARAHPPASRDANYPDSQR